MQRMHKLPPVIAAASRLASGVIIIYASLWGGRLLGHLLGGAMPASILGMLLLTLLLQLGLVKLHWVTDTANLFIRWMSLLFVPVGVSLVDNLDSLYSALPAMLLTCVVATLILLAMVGWGYQLLERMR